MTKATGWTTKKIGVHFWMEARLLLCPVHLRSPLQSAQTQNRFPQWSDQGMELTTHSTHCQGKECTEIYLQSPPYLHGKVPHLAWTKFHLFFFHLPIKYCVIVTLWMLLSEFAGVPTTYRITANTKVTNYTSVQQVSTSYFFLLKTNWYRSVWFVFKTYHILILTILQNFKTFIAFISPSIWMLK